MRPVQTPPARTRLRHPAVLLTIVALALTSAIWLLCRSGPGDGWPRPTRIGAGDPDAEVLRLAATNLRITSRGDLKRLDETQGAILGLIPLYMPGATPAQATRLAVIDPSTGQPTCLQALEQSLERLEAPACLAIVRQQLLPLSRGDHAVANRQIDEAFHAAWIAEGVEAKAAAYIRAHPEAFQ